MRNDGLFAHRGIHAKKTKRLNGAGAGDDHMRCYRHMIFDYAVMSNVVTTPQNDVTPNFDERLNGIVFKDKTVVTTIEPGKACGLRTNVADEFVAATPGLVVFLSPNVVHLLE